jgi:thiamine biosynthesis protein ThiC
MYSYVSFLKVRASRTCHMFMKGGVSLFAHYVLLHNHNFLYEIWQELVT